MAANAPAGGTTEGRSSLPPPCPKSPPKYPDLYGKRRGMAKLQMLEREIGFLEEELKSGQGLQPSSRCCKEVTDYVASNPDPFIPTNRKKRRSCRFWKWLRGIPCFNFSWVCCCCYSGCTLGQEPSDCCVCNPCDCCSGYSCPSPKCPSCCCSCSCPKSRCCSKPSCSGCGCCTCQCPSCRDCCCCRLTFNCPKCPTVKFHNCSETCCAGCCLFF